MSRPLVAALFVSALLAPAPLAQWSSDPATNLPIADAASDQAQPKVVRGPNDGCYVSWFDGIGTGYDVRLQRLDVFGNEQFAHEGLLVLDRGFSSTQDYGLALGGSGNALLACRDDSGTGVQITAFQVSPDGTMFFGDDGIQLTATTDFVAAPKIAGGLGLDAVVAWTQGNSVHVQGVTAPGVVLGSGGYVGTPAVGSYSVSDLKPGPASKAILSFVHQTGGFGSPRRLRANQFGSGGDPAWGPDGVEVFDSGSLQFGNFPEFMPDGSGGAVFSWYDAGSLQLQCYVQRLDSSGAELFPHNGVPVSLVAERVRVGPSADIDTVTGETYVFWVEQNSAQSQWGLYGQKLDASGARQWGEAGSALIPLGGTQISQVRCLAQDGGAAVFWEESPSFGSDVLRGAHVDSAGAFDIAPYDVASTPSGKMRLDATLGGLGNALLAWSDDRVDGGDVLGQAVEPDGALGPPGGYWTDLGSALAGTHGEPLLQTLGTLVPGTPFWFRLSGALENSTCGLFVGLSSINVPFKGGTLVPANDVLVVLPTDGAGELELGTGWPPGLPSGLTVHMQGWVVDAAGPVGFSASNAVARTVP